MKRRQLITDTRAAGNFSDLILRHCQRTTITMTPLNSQDQAATAEQTVTFQTISVRSAKWSALWPSVRKAAIIGATSLGIVCALFGAALIATGVLAPLGLTVLGLSAAVTSMILVGTTGLAVGALFGGLFGGLVGTKIDATKSNHIYRLAAKKSPRSAQVPGLEDPHASSDATMQHALGRPATQSSSTVADDDIEHIDGLSPLPAATASSRSSSRSPMSIAATDTDSDREEDTAHSPHK